VKFSENLNLHHLLPYYIQSCFNTCSIKDTWKNKYSCSGLSSFNPLGAYVAVIHLSNLIKNIFICDLKMNKGLTGLVLNDLIFIFG